MSAAPKPEKAASASNAPAEGIIDILDVIDRDVDLEPDGCDEPSLGWTSTMATGNRFDLEENETEVASWP